MGKKRRDITSICRLCLCEDENILFPATKITDATLTVDDIERFTGIRVISKTSTPYAVCIDCKNKLKKINNYRAFCLRNDVKFRRLFGVAVVDITEGTADSVKSQFASDGCDSTNPSFTIDDDNMTNMVIDESVETAEIEEHSVDGTEKSTRTQRSYVEMRDNSCDSLADGDKEAHIQKRQNESPFKTTDQVDTQGSPFWITSINDATAETPTDEVKKLKELCMLCGKLVSSVAAHMRTHTAEQNFACEHCPKKYSRKSYLRQHVLCVHFKKIIKTCKICDKGFSYVDSYVAHMRAKHNFGESFECRVCNLKFRHRGGLRSHTNRKHNIATNCECTICGMKFEHKKGLKDHGRVHSDEQPFACKYCTKRFKSPTARKTHELIHEGVKFPCTLCDKIYAYKTLLNSHMKKAHSTEERASPENS